MKITISNLIRIKILVLLQTVHIISQSALSFKDLFIGGNANTTELTNFDNIYKEILGKGEMGPFLTYQQFNRTIQSLTEDFPDIISIEEIGKTYNNNSITAIKLKSRYHNNRGILFTGMHHAREPVSMTMNVYILLKMIHLNLAGGVEARELLDSVNVYFIPIINVDGYIENNKIFSQKKNLESCKIRKNRRTLPVNEFKNCVGRENFDTVTVGVDINRNYGYQFGLDDEGSSNRPCDEDYRGSEAFSEPETQAIKRFIEEHSDIKIAFNYHSYGNLLIIPFNYVDSTTSQLNMFMNYTFQKSIYDEFREEGHFPEQNKMGNGMDTIQYKANGEAADWMLGEKRIIAFSPELGIPGNSAQTFYPDRNTMYNILEKNLESAMYGITRAAFYLKILNLRKSYIDCQNIYLFSHKFLPKDDDEKLEEKLCKPDLYQFTSQIQFYNSGFSDFKGFIEFEISIDSRFFEYLSIKLYTGRNSADLKELKRNETKNVGDSTNSTQNDTLKEKPIRVGNPNVINLYEVYYSKNNQTNDNSTRNDPNPAYEKTRFNMTFIEAFLHQIIEIKFYVNKKNFKMYNQNENLLEIRRIDDEFKKMKNNTSTHNFELKFNKPEYNLKLSEFEKFEFNINMKDKPTEKESSESSFGSYYKLFVLGVLTGLILIFLIALKNLRSSANRENPIPVQPSQNVEVSPSPEEGNNSYLELSSSGRDF